MHIRILTEEQQQVLRSNPYVESCTSKTLTYTKDFKLYALQQYRTGQGTTKEIFTRVGFNIDVIGHDTPKDCIKRWKKSYAEHGVYAFTEEHRGKGSIGRPQTKNISPEEKIRRLELENAYLKEENILLTYLRAKRAESNSRLHKNTKLLKK